MVSGLRSQSRRERRKPADLLSVMDQFGCSAGGNSVKEYSTGCWQPLQHVRTEAKEAEACKSLVSLQYKAEELVNAGLGTGGLGSNPDSAYGMTRKKLPDSWFPSLKNEATKSCDFKASSLWHSQAQSFTQVSNCGIPWYLDP